MTAKVLHSKETIEARKKAFEEMKAELPKVVEVEEGNTPTEKDKKAKA